MMENDMYGRTVVKNDDQTQDSYTVTGPDGQLLNLNFPIGTPLAQVYSTINAMAPDDYVKPDPDIGGE